MVSKELTPAHRMAAIGILQRDDPALRTPARPFDLPRDAAQARHVIDRVLAAMDRVARAHVFAKGMGLAAPQIGIDLAAAVIRPADPGGSEIVLLNPRIVDESRRRDVQYEGCMSFFDVRGRVDRPLRVEVEHRRLDGGLVITRFTGGLARHVCHEIDHLEGRFYTDRMPAGDEVIPLSQYRGSGRPWG
ncbi:peptide deformylase [Paractinoplanes atraurantiacus]|uniref:Peptide deformylase n=1 Tax=Paractinoplanes atraurantiacus TaxID=1036182 RepID=A0A285IQ75_9ACTN|nr:peptide deformylase [Actinoplanes atraurantiacus]SNY50148.1 peptide deformylase [Actinoplanes atraurantiacus]